MKKHHEFTDRIRDHVIPVQTVLHADMTVQEAIDELRTRKIEEQVVYFYVVDAEKKLIGVVPSRNLLLRDHDLKISEIMDRSVVSVHGDESLEKGMELLVDRHLLVIPVVDENDHFIGCIDGRMFMEESMEFFNARFQQDIFQMIGVKIEEGKRPRSWKSFASRMPWIVCNMVGGIGCAIIAHFYEAILLKVILFAMFIPLVLSLAESISMQSMSQSMLLIRDHITIRWKRIFLQTFREGKVTLLLALTSGLLVGSISLFWGEGLGPAITIAVSLVAGITIAASFGAAIPLILHLKRLDPKVAGGPIVLALADIISTLIYLSLATWWLL